MSGYFAQADGYTFYYDPSDGLYTEELLYAVTPARRPGLLPAAAPAVRTPRTHRSTAAAISPPAKPSLRPQITSTVMIRGTMHYPLSTDEVELIAV